MATGFSAADFAIVPDGDLLPMPIADENGFQRYSANLMLPSRTQLNVLASYKSGVEIIPALGGGGTIVIKYGVGKKTLFYPMQNNVEGEVLAVLITLSAQVRFLHSDHILASAEWILAE